MLSVEDLNPHKFPTTFDIDANMMILCDRLNIIGNAYDKPMVVTSGLRSQELQTTLIAEGKSTAVKSKHLTGEAVDILDKDGSFWKWCMVHMDLLVDVGFWLEDKAACPTWTHLQIVPPASGKRIFKP